MGCPTSSMSSTIFPIYNLQSLKVFNKNVVLFQAALDTVRGTKLATIASELVKPLNVG